jgi:2-iminobutanoate/2-iminopropanoate deaminase
MNLKTISTDDAPKAIGPYSQAVEYEKMIFLSGQVGINPGTGNIDSSTIEGQTKQVMTNLEAVLRASGSDLSHVVKCTVFLTDLEEFQSFNKTYASFFKSNLPARSTVQIAKLPRNAKVEIDVIAVRI